MRSAARSSANCSPSHSAIAHATTFGFAGARLASSGGSASFICLITVSISASCNSDDVGRPDVELPVRSFELVDSQATSAARRTRLERRSSPSAASMEQNLPQPREEARRPDGAALGIHKFRCAVCAVIKRKAQAGEPIGVPQPGISRNPK